nr:AAA family ATPase [Candidatus Cloacimonadota bacterium]
MHELANYQERIFVITGMCRDLFCTPSNQMIFFDRLLHIYLKENLEYESVVFLDSRGIYYYDVESKNILKSIDDIKKTNAHSKLKRYKNLVIKKDDIKNNNQITERLRYTYQNDIAEIINFIIFHLGNQKRMAFIVYDDILFENLNRGSESWVLFHGFLRNNIMRLMPDVKNIIVFVSDKEDLLVADRYRRIHLEYLYSINENNVEGIAKRIFIPPSSSDEIKRVIMLNLLSLKIKPAYRDVEKLVDHLNGIFSVKELKLNLLINANEEKTSYYDSLKQKYYYKNNGISAWDELNQLIGVTDIKEKVKTLVQGIQKKNRTYVNDYQNMPNRVKTIEKESLPLIPHIALLGNSGTGKTTIARLIARILKEEGILEKGHLIESSRADLVSQYVGETGIKTRQLVEKALGGVLFIDEAYSLITGDNDTVGIEALSQLIGHMSAYQGQFMTIFAGYKEDTIKMLSYNQGGARRIQQWDINDYNEEELSEIMRYHLDKLNQPVDSFVFENTHNYCYHVLLNHSKFAKNNHFGNAGVITNIVNNAITKCLSLQSDKLKTEHFENQDFFKQVDRTKGQLDDLVGLDDIKDTLKVYFRRKKIENNLSPGHFVFTGNPGTGKTMVANMIAHELCRLKIINRAVIK